MRDISSLKDYISVLQESLPCCFNSMVARYGIPFENGCDVSVLLALDQARKAHDLMLSQLGHEAECYDHTLVNNERIILNSLRKWKGPVTGNLQLIDDVFPSKIGDVTNGLREYRERSAIEGFVARNQLAASRRETADELLVYMSRVIKRMLDGFMPEYQESNPRFGNGAVYERMSVLHRWDSIGRNPDYDPINGDISWRAPSGCTRARLAAVPKQWNKDRLITVEPHLSTFIQHKTRLALGRTLVRNGFGFLVDQGISGYDGPAVHRLRALEASCYSSPESEWATLDLSDASDSITYFQVIEVFPPEVMACLDRGRSTEFEFKLESDKTPRVEVMSIFGGMGNATTFMVETIMFYALMRAAVARRRLPWKGGSTVGDDLLIKGLDQVDAVLEDLAILGYKVNPDKSFTGLATPCRESCGCWAFNGSDVYVPPFEGYGETAAGRLGLADYVRRAPAPLEHTLHTRLKHWVNTPVKVANTVSVCDTTRAVSHSRIHWNRRLMRLEVKVLAPGSQDTYVDHNYEANFGSCLAVLVRQVKSKPLPITPGDRVWQDLRFTQDRLFYWTTIHGYQDVNQVPDKLWREISKRVMEEKDHWKPTKWRQYALSVTKPYSTTLTHQSCAIQEGEGSHWLPPTSCGRVDWDWTNVICAFNKRESQRKSNDAYLRVVINLAILDWSI